MGRLPRSYAYGIVILSEGEFSDAVVPWLAFDVREAFERLELFGF